MGWSPTALEPQVPAFWISLGPSTIKIMKQSRPFDASYSVLYGTGSGSTGSEGRLFGVDDPERTQEFLIRVR
jgi:hypothetical protein